jgi:hypothetical protein
MPLPADREPQPAIPLWDEYTMRLAGFEPQANDVPVDGFYAEHKPVGWQRYADLVRMIQVPGTHYGCITTHVADLCDAILAALATDAGRDDVPVRFAGQQELNELNQHTA